MDLLVVRVLQEPYPSRWMSSYPSTPLLSRLIQQVYVAYIRRTIYLVSFVNPPPQNSILLKVNKKNICDLVATDDQAFIDHVQLLLHGSTYTSQYWTWPISGFQNYSYVSHACTQGQSTFTYDQVGVGLSDRPTNSTDIQLPTSASISTSLAHKLKSGEIAAAFGLAPKRFKKVIAIGHSQGSVVFNYAAIVSGVATPFDAMVLTGHIHDPTFLANAKLPRPAARDVNPARWSNLDPGYITISNRSEFYSPNNLTFSADLVQIDELTKDVSTLWYTEQTAAIYVPATGYKGPVVELVGSNDQLHCLNNGDGFIPCNATVLQVSEAPFFPDSRNFTMIVREGQGHDVNLDFGAAEMFKVFTELARELIK
jgi:pimeloyl-ACP methyl ester carboxylesterase